MHKMVGFSDPSVCCGVGFFAKQTSDLRICEIETSDFRIFCLIDVKFADFRKMKICRIFGVLKKIDRIIGSTTPPGVTTLATANATGNQ
jgi:hypothetical protein